jgi:hypothetical protein
MMRLQMWRRIISIIMRILPIIMMMLAGCFYPPQQKPLASSRTEITLPLPYDLAWAAVHHVIERNQFRIVIENPDEGMIEVQTVDGFSIADADCGQMTGITGKYDADPGLDSSAVYDFEVQPKGTEATIVRVQATFTAPVHIPFHLPRGEQCLSRGRQEKRLLRAIILQARNEHRVEVTPTPAIPLPGRQTVE